MGNMYEQRRIWGVFLALMVFLSLLGNVMPIELPLCIDSALSCLLLFYMGSKLRESINTKQVVKATHLPLWCLGIIFLLNGYMIFLNGTVNIRRNQYSHIELYWINAVFAMLFYLNVAIRLENSSVLFARLKKALKFIGKNSLTFLVFNELLIYVVKNIISVKILAMQENIILSLVIFIIVILSMVIICELVNRTKLKVLMGKF